ncbi:hypothetical protein ROR02_06780 [Pararhodospirillum oryzae]|uniref:Uncharacterized protein n=1 Tax=Pararhodospirillum oryzae TaxID=478448 RepID=A0A512H532_9PROT|nr:hypothetical protein ROR02_06780 [Pararhodospirillum oryzae]
MAPVRRLNTVLLPELGGPIRAMVRWRGSWDEVDDMGATFGGAFPDRDWRRSWVGNGNERGPKQRSTGQDG